MLQSDSFNISTCKSQNSEVLYEPSKNMKIENEITLLNSYTDSLDNLLKIEKELNTMRKKSALKINYMNDKLNTSSVKHSKKNICLKEKPNFIEKEETNSEFDVLKIIQKGVIPKKLESQHGSHRIHNSTYLVEKLNGVFYDLINQNSHDEKLLSKYLNIMINIKERAAINFAKNELLHLKIKSNNTVEHFSSLKKKQRGILIKLQHEYNEIKLMKNFQKKLFNERKKSLVRQLKHFRTMLGINIYKKIPGNINFKNSIFNSQDCIKNLPVKCYDIISNQKDKYDLYEKQIKLCNHKRTLNELLLLYFDLQLNTIALNSMDKRSSHSKIIRTLKDLSRKSMTTGNKRSIETICTNVTALDNYKPKEVISDVKFLNDVKVSSNSNKIINLLNPNCATTKSCSSNLDTLESIRQIDPISKIEIKLQSETKKMSNEFNDMKCSTTENVNNNSIDDFNKKVDVLDLKAMTVLPIDKNFTNNVKNTLYHSQTTCMKIDKNKSTFTIFGIKYSLLDANFTKKTKEKSPKKQLNYLSIVSQNLSYLKFHKYIGNFLKYKNIFHKSLFYDTVNFYEFIINNHINDLFKKFHMFIQLLLGKKHYEICCEILNILGIEKNKEIDSIKNALKSDDYIHNKKYSEIHIKNFSLNDFSRVINALEFSFFNEKLLENKLLDLKDFKHNFFLINIRENLDLDTINIKCIISENTPALIEYSSKIYGHKKNNSTSRLWQIYESSSFCSIIHEVSSEKPSMVIKLKNVTAASSASSVDRRTPIKKSNTTLKENANNQINASHNSSYSAQVKCKQLDIAKDDCYQKIVDVRPRRQNKSPLSKQLVKELSDISPKKKLDLFPEKKIGTLASEQNIHGKVLPYALSKPVNQLDEAEELRKKQLAVEMEIKALLEQQTSQFSYFLVREIPDKPPPPYIPPDGNNKFNNENIGLQLLKNDALIRKEQVADIIKICYENIWLPFLSKSYSNKCDTAEIFKNECSLFKKNNSINNHFVFDLCNELFSSKYRNMNKKFHTWEYQRGFKQSKDEICKTVEIMTKQYLGYNTAVKDSIFINCAHKLQDHVDELLIRELQDEEIEWVNIEEYEIYIKNFVTESILNELIKNTVKEYVALSTNS